MKLDDTGAAFFVEPVDSEEEGEISNLLATSPIETQKDFVWNETKKEAGIYVSSAVQTEPLKGREIAREKSNKRKKRKKKQHSRNNSNVDTTNAGSNDLFPMDDINDADHEDEDMVEPQNILRSDSTIRTHQNLQLRRSNSISSSTDVTGKRNHKKYKRAFSTNSTEPFLPIDQGLIGSRVPFSATEAETKFIEDLLTEVKDDILEINLGYHSESELKQINSVDNLDSSVLSDSEVDNLKKDEAQNIWN